MQVRLNKFIMLSFWIRKEKHHLRSRDKAGLKHAHFKLT